MVEIKEVEMMAKRKSKKVVKIENESPHIEAVTGNALKNHIFSKFRRK